MQPTVEQPRRPFSISLRTKIILAFVALSALLSAAFGGFTYRNLNQRLFQELRSRVRSLTQVGSHLIDRAALRSLIARVDADLDAEAVLEVEKSAEYRLVSRQLNHLRDTEKGLIKYVYIFVPTRNENTALYVVDADVPDFLRARELGEEVDEEEISHFASEFDVSEFPVARQAIREAANLVEAEYSYDEAFQVNSVSGYAPIFDEDGVTLLAMLGIDMVDKDARAVLRRNTALSLLTAFIALLAALVTSILLGTYMTRGIIALDRVVRSFSEKNMAVRAEVKSADEVGRLGRSFNAMAEIIRRYSDQLESLLKAYGRFVPHDFLRFLKKESIVDVRLGDQVQQEMTVLFSDIRSFTALSEKMSPAENFNFINSFLGRIGPEIRGHGGFIDKYIGDAIMALFPHKPDDAVRAAVAMRRRLAEYNGHRRSSGYVPIEVGIGIHTGTLMLGTVGEQERMDGSVISDAVNLASRLEALTRLYGGTILVTGYTLSQLFDPREFHHRFLDRVRVRGRSEAVLIYEIFDGDPPGLFEQKEAGRAEWSRALGLYYDRQFKEAYRILYSLRRRDSRDPSLDLYLRRCLKLIKSGVPEGWQGIETINLK